MRITANKQEINNKKTTKEYLLLLLIESRSGLLSTPTV